MPTHEQALVAEARRIARLQHKQRRLKADLKAVATELKTARRNLKALAQRSTDPFEQTPPLRMFGEK